MPEKLWNHIENVAPGLILAFCAFTLCGGPRMDLLKTYESSMSIGSATIAAGVLLAAAYVLGVTNAAVARWLFSIKFMDDVRWWHLHSLAEVNSSLQEQLASLFKARDYAAIVAFVKTGTLALANGTTTDYRVPAWRRKRAVFHRLSGWCLQSIPALAAEINERRIAARLLRSSIMPGIFVSVCLNRHGCCAPVLPWAFVLASLGAYYYSECSVADIIEVYMNPLQIYPQPNTGSQPLSGGDLQPRGSEPK